MPGTPILTIASSVVAFALGFQMFREAAVPAPSQPPTIAQTQSPSQSTQPAAAPISKSKPELPIPLHLLEAVEFESFDQELNLTSEARHLLSITDDEAAAVSQAALQLRNSVEQAQAKTIRASRYPDLIYEDNPVYAEVDPLGPLADSLIHTYRVQIDEALGTERAEFISIPFEISPDESILYVRRSGDRPGFNEVRVVWSPQGDGSVMSLMSRTKRVPDYAIKFLAMQEDSE